MSGYTADEVLERSKEEEYDLFKDELLGTLYDALPEDGEGHKQYLLQAYPKKIESRIDVKTGSTFEPPKDYEWPVLHDHDRIPDGVATYPQYFLVEQGKCDNEQAIKDGEYAVAIDRHLKYIEVTKPYRSEPGLIGIPGGALNRFALEWDRQTTYGGALHNPGGEDVPLGNVKFLE